MSEPAYKTKVPRKMKDPMYYFDPLSRNPNKLVKKELTEEEKAKEKKLDDEMKRILATIPEDEEES